MKKHSFDDLVNQKAGNHEAPVPAGIWEAIEQKKKKKRRYLFFWWTTGFAILLATGIWFATGKAGNTRETVASRSLQDKPLQESFQNDKQITVSVQDDKQIPAPVTRTKSSAEAVITPPAPELPAQSAASSDKELEKNIVIDKIAVSVRSQKSRSIANKTVIAAQTTEAPITGLPANGKSEMGSKNPRKNSLPETQYTTEVGDLLIKEKEIAFKQTTDSIIKGDFTENNTLYRDRIIARPMISNISPENKLSLPLEAFYMDSLANDIALATRKLTLSRLDSVDPSVAATTNRLSKKSSWSIEASATAFLPVEQSQSLLYLTRNSNSPMLQTEFKTEKIHTRLQPAMAYTISVRKKINQRLQLGIGLQSAIIKEKIELTGTEKRTIYTEIERLVNGTNGPELIKDTVENISTGVLTIDALNSYRFFSVPVSVQYLLLRKSAWSLQVNGGVVVNIATRYHNSIQGQLVQVNNNGIHTGQTKKMNSLDLFTGIRLAHAYRSYQFFVEPVLRYSTRRYDLNNMLNRKFLHQAGIAVGIAYQFR